MSELGIEPKETDPKLNFNSIPVVNAWTTCLGNSIERRPNCRIPITIWIIPQSIVADTTNVVFAWLRQFSSYCGIVKFSGPETGNVPFSHMLGSTYWSTRDPVIRDSTANVPTEAWRDVPNNEYNKQLHNSVYKPLIGGTLAKAPYAKPWGRRIKATKMVQIHFLLRRQMFTPVWSNNL